MAEPVQDVEGIAADEEHSDCCELCGDSGFAEHYSPDASSFQLVPCECECGEQVRAHLLSQDSSNDK